MARIVEESYIADLKKWAEGKFEESENGMGYALLEVAVDLKNMPSVVRCRDCKHMEVTPDCLRWCHVWNGINGMGDDGFCNYGERKDNG